MPIQHPFLRQLDSPSLDGTLVKTKVLATHYGKSNDYILVQPFTVSPVAWEGVSLIHQKISITLPGNISIVRLPTAPVGVNFCPCIFWRVSEGVGFRYKLWENVGERLFAPLYNGERIPSSFVIEFWNCVDETDITLATTLEILVSTLSYSTLLCGDGGTEVAVNQTTGGDFIYDSNGVSVDYSLGDHWLQSGLDDVSFENLGDPSPPTGPESPDEVTSIFAWYDAEYLPVTKPDITDGQPVGISYPVYSGWVSKPPTSGYVSYQVSSGIRPVYKTNIIGAKPGVLFDGNDQMPFSTSLEPGGWLTLAVVCKQVSQAGGLMGGGSNLVIATNANKLGFGYMATGPTWTLIESTVGSTAETDIKLWVCKFKFSTGEISFRENKTAKGSATFTPAAGFESFTSIGAGLAAQSVVNFGGYIFEWILWSKEVTNEDLDSLYDNYFKPKWTDLP